MKLIIKQQLQQPPKVQEAKVAIQQTNSVAPQNEKAAKQTSSNEGKAAPTPFQLKIPGKEPAQIGAVQTNSVSKPETEKKPEPIIHNIEPASTSPLAQITTNQVTGIQYTGQPDGIDPKLFEEFQQTKNILHNCLVESKDMIGFALRRVMTDLRAHPELAEFMLPEDSGAMIKALRESYQVTLAIKEKKAAKKKKKTGPEIELDDLKGMLVDL